MALSERRVVVFQALTRRAHDVASELEITKKAVGRLDEFLAAVVLSEPRLRSRSERDRFEGAIASWVRVYLSGASASTRRMSLDDIANFAAIAGGRDPVIAYEVPGESGQATYTQTDLFGSEPIGLARPALAGRMAGRAARAFDSVPPRIYLPRYKETQSSEYSFELDAGPGNYVLSVAAAPPDGLNLRGVGTQVVHGDLGTSTRGRAPGRPGALQVRLRQNESGAALRALAVSGLVAGVAASTGFGEIFLAGSATTRGTNPLEALSWAVGVVSVAFVALWAVLTRANGTGVLATIPLAVASLAAGLLVSMTIVLGVSPESASVLDWIATVALANFALALTSSIIRLSVRHRALSRDANTDLEGPYL